MIVRREITIMLLLFSVCLSQAVQRRIRPSRLIPHLSRLLPPVQTRAEKATTSIQAVENDMKTMTSQINSTNSSLNQVILSKGTPAARGAFDTFSANVSQMESAAAAFIKDSDQMTARGTDYFQEWSKSGNTYTNPQIQQLSEMRRTELTNTFRQMSDSSSAVKGQVNSYLSQIKQIRTYLSNDVSRAGIDAISPVAQKAINDGQQIISQVQPILTAAEQARAEIGAAGAAAGGVSSPGM